MTSLPAQPPHPLAHNMCIANIENAFIRRFLLLILFVPVIVLAVLWEVGKILLEFVKEIPGDFVHAWNGPEKRSRHLLRD